MTGLRTIKLRSGSYQTSRIERSKRVSAQKNTFALGPVWGSLPKQKRLVVYNNKKYNNRPPNNKNEHAIELEGEPRLPFVLSGICKPPPLVIPRANALFPLTSTRPQAYVNVKVTHSPSSLTALQ